MNARLYTPDVTGSPRSVRFKRRPGVVVVDGEELGPGRLELAYPGYVLEIVEGFPDWATASGFRTVRLSDDPWHPAQTPTEVLLASYPLAWLFAFGLALWAESGGIKPWELLTGTGASFPVRWAAAIVLVSILAVPINRWLDGLVDRWVVDRIQQYTTLHRLRDLTSRPYSRWQS